MRDDCNMATTTTPTRASLACFSPRAPRARLKKCPCFAGTSKWAPSSTSSAPVDSEMLKAVLAAVTEAAAHGGRLARRMRPVAFEVGVVTKSDDSPVTAADLAVQRLITRTLHAHFPNGRVIGEEDVADDAAVWQNAALRRAVTAAVAAAEAEAEKDTHIPTSSGDGDVEFVVDPIDGTRAYIDGGDCAQYTVAVAAMRWVDDGKGGRRREPAAGAMALPNWRIEPPLIPAASSSSVGILIAAATGGGCWWRALDDDDDAAWRPLRVIDPRALCDAVAVVSESTASHDELRCVRARFHLRHMCCGSLCKYAAVALGAASLYPHAPQHPSQPARYNIWDHAAGVVCVVEAGAVVSDYLGAPLDFSGDAVTFTPGGGGVWVASPAVHAEVVRARMCVR